MQVRTSIISTESSKSVYTKRGKLRFLNKGRSLGTQKKGKAKQHMNLKNGTGVSKMEVERKIGAGTTTLIPDES